ncbi:MAG TPA: thiol-disulfide oxidoreductase DCC family protein [Gemmataceae bacterium]|nr:thiol-disulfide oxidoreductase DCC family protein [Gemmataceae bacterium]
MPKTPVSWPANVNKEQPIVLFDGVCNLCNGLVQFLIRRDGQARLRLASLQSTSGQALLTWCGQPLEDFDTMVFIESGRAFFKSTAILRILRYFPWPWPMLSIALVIPTWLRDWFYDRVALNRYVLFGRRETCMMPTPELKKRFLD